MPPASTGFSHCEKRHIDLALCGVGNSYLEKAGLSAVFRLPFPPMTVSHDLFWVAEISILKFEIGIEIGSLFHVAYFLCVIFIHTW